VQDRNEVLFKYADLSKNSADNASEIKQNIAYLFERFLHKTSSETETNRLYENIYIPAEITDTFIESIPTLFILPKLRSFDDLAKQEGIEHFPGQFFYNEHLPSTERKISRKK